MSLSKDCSFSKQSSAPRFLICLRRSATLAEFAATVFVGGGAAGAFSWIQAKATARGTDHLELDEQS
jgi:hypothetical protein